MQCSRMWNSMVDCMIASNTPVGSAMLLIAPILKAMTFIRTLICFGITVIKVSTIQQHQLMGVTPILEVLLLHKN